MKTLPLVSIGLPVYNGENYLRQALDSLLMQDYTNFELIISDNASTDRTREICFEYTTKDNRIKYYRNQINTGAPANFNRVFELSSGDYFMWASHDDYREPSYISKCLNAFSASDKIVLVGAECDWVTPQKDVVLVDKSLSTIRLDAVRRFMRYKRILHDCDKHKGGIFYGIFRRNVLCKVMPLKCTMTTDQNMMLELCLLGEFITVKERLLTRRMDGTSSHGLKAWGHSYGITNPFLIYGVYFVREWEIAKLVAKSGLNTFQKAWLICWSLLHTFVTVGAHLLSLGYRRIAR